jgi:hypothetical protein
MSSSQYYEGASASVSGSCSYGKLNDKYNNGFKGMVPPVPALPAGAVAGTYAVPVYGTNGYNTLLHGGSGYSSYPDIRSAYRSSADGSCDPKYTLSNCSS